MSIFGKKHERRGSTSSTGSRNAMPLMDVNIEDPTWMPSAPNTDADPKLQEKLYKRLQMIGNTVPYRKRWMSMYIMYFMMFVSNVCFSVVLPGLSSYVGEIVTDSSSRATIYQLSVAAFSVGQMISSLCVGPISNKTGVKLPLIVCTAIGVLANLIYMLGYGFEDGYIAVVLARFFAGIAAGNAALVRSYIAQATNVSEVMGALTKVSAIQVVGVSTGPAFTAIFGALGSQWKIEVIPNYLLINTRTIAGLISAILCLVAMWCAFFFQPHTTLISKKKRAPQSKSYGAASLNSTETTYDPPAVNPDEDSDDDEEKENAYEETGDGGEKPLLGGGSSKTAAQIQASNAPVPGVSPKRNWKGIITCLWIGFEVFCLFSMYEALTPVYMQDEFNEAPYFWTAEENAITYNGILLMGGAILGFIPMFLAEKISKKIGDPMTMVVGQLFLLFGNLLQIPFGNPEVVGQTHCYIDPRSEVVEMHPWCATTGKLPFAQIIAATVIGSLGYPLVIVTVVTCFSKILGRVKQGAWMGIFTAICSLSRVVGPFAFISAYDTSGPIIVFSIACVLCSISIIMLVIFRKACDTRLAVRKLNTK